jgi:hypothetical protein
MPDDRNNDHATPSLLPLSGRALLLIVCLTLTACQEDQGEDFYEARAYRVTSLGQLIGGPKALGNMGDFILENDKIRVLVNGQPTDWVGASPNKWGGAVLDADIRRFEEYGERYESGRDLLLEVVPMFDLKTFGYDTLYAEGPVVRIPQDAILVQQDGSGTGAAEVKVTGVLKNLLYLFELLPVPNNNGFYVLLTLLEDLLGAPITELFPGAFVPVKAETVYRLEPGKNHLEITTTFTVLNSDESEPSELEEIPLEPISEQDNPLEAVFQGDVFGDAIFYGESLDAIGPGIFGFSTSFFTEELYNAGKSILNEAPLLDWSAAVADDIGYGLVSPDGKLSFPILEDFLTVAFQKVQKDERFRKPEPGQFFRYTRYLVVDEGDVAGVLDHIVDLKGMPHGTLEGNVYFGDAGRAASGVHVLLCKHPRFTADGSLVPVVDNLEAMNGVLQGLAPDEVDLRRLIPYSRFRTDARRFDALEDGSFEGKVPVGHYILVASGPGFTRSKLLPIEIAEGKTLRVTLPIQSTGTLRVTVRSRDEGRPDGPAKITIIGVNGEASPDPFLGEGFHPAEITKVLLTRDGHGEVQLPVGTYRVIAGRGPEYSADERTVTLHPLEVRNIQMTIRRVVDTSGWIAADLHMHTEVSPDSGVPFKDRLLSAMTEGLDLIAGTDHDYIPNYRPRLESLGGQNLIRFMPGVELSHFSYAHFNAYPIQYDPTAIAGGSPNWRNPSPSATLPDGSPMPEFTPQDCFDAMRALTDWDEVSQEAFVQINHTQESFTGYLRAFGFDQYYGTFGSPDFLTIGDPVVNNGGFFPSSPPEGEEPVHFSWDFDGMEILNAKRWHDFRTATQEEILEPGNEIPPIESPLFPILVRTAEEQDRILRGDLLLDSSNRGGVDDYLTLLAMGKRVTALGTSDSHTTVKTENGKCRTYIMSSSDQPEFIDLDEVITHLKRQRAVASNGPFMEAWVNGEPIGSDLLDGDGTVTLRIRAQAPEWMSLDRIEIYGNGILIGEIGRDVSTRPYPFLTCDTSGKALHGTSRTVRFDDTVSCSIETDTFFVVIGIGYEGMSPHITPVEGPTVDIVDSLALAFPESLRELIIDLLLGGILQRNHEIYPYVVTNAIFVDRDGQDADGDGFDFDGPGFIPGWFDEEDLPPELDDPEVQLGIFSGKARYQSLSSRFRRLR